MQEIILYDYWRSSAAYRLRIALNLLGISYRRISVNLLEGAQNHPEHLARNPQGLVPALWIDGQMMTQSLAILEYLQETRGGLLPEDPLARQNIRRIAHAIAMEIHPICNLRTARHAVAASQGAITQEDWMKHFISQGLEPLEHLLSPGNYCFGDQISIADICLVPQIYNARRWGVTPKDFPRSFAISEALERHPAFATAAPVAP